MTAENAVAFGLNEALKRAFPYDKDSHSSQLTYMLRPFLMGGITGCCSALVLLPSEVIKAKTQVTVGSTSSKEVLQTMIKRNGFKSLFCGLDAQLMRDGSFYTVFFGTYQLNCHMCRTYLPSVPDEVNFFFSGGFAGMFGWMFAMPFDVPKTNVQSRYDTKVVGSYFPELFKIGRKQGISGLYNGLGPVLIRAFPANAALFLGVEMGKRFFDKTWLA